jgi:hypothetical protein
MIWHFDYHRVRPLVSLKRTTVPICFIHGKNDLFIPCSMSEELFQQCRNPNSELHLVNEAQHAQSYLTDPDKYEQIVRDFVQKIEKWDAK